MKVYVSDDGLTSCPSCLQHIAVAPNLSETTCRFCGTLLTVALKGPVGRGAMGVLSSSRSGKIAAALAGLGLTLTVGCTEPEPDEPIEKEDITNHEEMMDYGTFPNNGWEEPDSGGGDIDAEVVHNHEEMMDYGTFPNNNFEPEPDASHQADASDVDADLDVADE